MECADCVHGEFQHGMLERVRGEDLHVGRGCSVHGHLMLLHGLGDGMHDGIHNEVRHGMHDGVDDKGIAWWAQRCSRRVLHGMGDSVRVQDDAADGTRVSRMSHSMAFTES
jgi:hypothetical protein